ncbi:MAG: nitroreductase family protein [Flavobacteriales bacterium]|nr:nitroreductase family protein [Flavobacteriales bacterium]
MADGYLEKRMEEYLSGKNSSGQKTVAKLTRLLRKNRSTRGYDSRFIIKEEHLRKIITVNTLIPSARNQQVLRFGPLLHDDAKKILPLVHMGGALPELHLPLKDTEPNAFIIICSTVPENRYVDMDLGISVQSMLLQAVEMGLSGLCIGAFDKEAIKNTFDLKYEPLLILAIGKSAEKIELCTISPEDSHSYYRKDGVHFVPKISVDDLIF